MKLAFWIFPVVSAVAWLVTLLTMLIYWNACGRPHYVSMSPGQHIAYISDVGATKLKPLFVIGCIIMTLCLDAGFLAERWLRHKGILAKNSSWREKLVVILSIIFAVIGTAGLILLSGFDTKHYPHLHRIFLVFFMGGYVFSAIFSCWEYQRLGVKFREHRVLRLSFWIKLGFILIEVVLAVIFGSFMYKGNQNVAAVLEWIIAFIFTFYVFSYIIDLLPAAKKQNLQNELAEAEGEIEEGSIKEGSRRDGHHSSTAQSSQDELAHHQSTYR